MYLFSFRAVDVITVREIVLYSTFDYPMEMNNYIYPSVNML